jgi:proline-specific peptidase
MYDQLGCGNSYLDGHPELWTKETWLNELIALRKHLGLDEVHILGQSWGGMLAIIYECDCKPEGVASYILSSTLPYNAIWESEQKRRVGYLPKEMQDAIAKAEKSGNYDDPDYDVAITEFMRRHCTGPFGPDAAECLTRKKKSGTEAYVAGWGPNEFTPTGSLRDYNYLKQLESFSKPALICSGGEDLCSPYIAKLMYDAIPDAEWELFRYSRHMCFVDEEELYKKVLMQWLNKHD